MKRAFHLIAVIMSLVLLVGCASDNSGDKKSMNINLEGIEQITVSTQTTGQKQDVIIEKEKFEDLISKLNSYSLKEITDEKDKGWQYLIKIEKKGGEITLISFMDNKVKVNDIVYEVRDYNIDDFSYLFE
jgi:major membrane immunogen (membrane-anchored lipoprotein)